MFQKLKFCKIKIIYKFQRSVLIVSDCFYRKDMSAKYSKKKHSIISIRTFASMSLLLIILYYIIFIKLTLL